MMKRLLFLFLALCSQLAGAATLTVSAASSLSNAMTQVAKRYEQEHPSVTIDLNFAASGVLYQQIRHGAPVDVWISADQKTMDMAQEEGLIQTESRQNLLGNELVLITAIDSGLNVKDLSDLNEKKIQYIALGDPQSVPVGRYAKLALEHAGLFDVLKDKYILTKNVRQSLDYVARSEVNVGFVYATDASIRKNKVKVLLTVDLADPVFYPVALTKTASDSQLAKDFLHYLFSEKAQAIFHEYGFSSIK
ncbi:molybdate ABC transporter substrate-binding protein [Basilea psittacipulmonis]|uniref:Molybdate ABC transporter substrate-binding protein n=1 Tax=Basilea psittacipulmonis DSM 24701 TaxID=1072685 RepID=A0A077DDT1_9BURK|nr:molybdate ABC transporter substrate-binding protein [Basilea psittacipulmonis]AIL32764.1 hypothetical protein IX83_05075 [Basilea psittacipulmonis DSM 24701]